MARTVAQVPFILQATGQRERFWFWREDEGTALYQDFLQTQVAALGLRFRF